MITHLASSIIPSVVRQDKGMSGSTNTLRIKYLKFQKVILLQILIILLYFKCIKNLQVHGGFIHGIDHIRVYIRFSQSLKDVMLIVILIMIFNAIQTIT